MVEMTVTDFARNLRKAFDRVERRGEEILLVRNKHRIARIVPGSPHLDALEAMGDLYRVDTCIWVDVVRGTIAPGDVKHYTADRPVFISPVTIAELTFGLEMATTEDIRARRRAALERLKKKPLLAIDEATGEVFGRLAARLRKQQLSHKHRVQDLWLASQAIQHAYALLTRNVEDFADQPGLELVEYGS